MGRVGSFWGVWDLDEGGEYVFLLCLGWELGCE